MYATIRSLHYYIPSCLKPTMLFYMIIKNNDHRSQDFIKIE